MAVTISFEALKRLTEKQRDTIVNLSNENRNAIEVATSFELPKDYVSFLLWYNETKSGTPIYGGIDASGQAST